MDPSHLKQQLTEMNAAHGLVETAKRAGLAPATVLRILAGLTVREGTWLTADRHLALSTMPLPSA